MISQITTLMQDEISELHFRQRQPLGGPPQSLLVLLHGVGGNENNLVELGESMDWNTLVVFPRGPIALGSDSFGWFNVKFIANGPEIVAQEADMSRRRLISFVQQMQNMHGIRPDRTVIGGFSQGGIISASVGLSSPETVAGFAVLAGRILPEIRPFIGNADSLRKLDAFIAHGIFDTKLPFAWAQRAAELLEEFSVPCTLHTYASGHALGADMRNDFVAWAQHYLN